MSEIVISTRLPKVFSKYTNRNNCCSFCGRPLKNTNSLKRKYGPSCSKRLPHNAIIVLDIRSDNDQK